MNQSTFDLIYKASLPPGAAALMKSGAATTNGIPGWNTTAQQQAALAVSLTGYPVDVQIMVWGWDPFYAMQMRYGYGFTWVPCLGQPNISVAPGLMFPGSIPYDPNNPLPGSIKVAEILPTAEDTGQNDAEIISMYPPYKNPNPTPPPVSTSLVGNFVGEDGAGVKYYVAIQGASTPLQNGASYTDPNGRGVFTYHTGQEPMGNVYWFTQP